MRSVNRVRRPSCLLLLTVIAVSVMTSGCQAQLPGGVLDNAWNFVSNSKAEAKQLTAIFDRLDNLVGNSIAAIANRALAKAWWTGYKAFFNKTYPSQEADNAAFETFKANLRRIRKIALDDLTSFWGGVNELTDQSFTDLQFTRLMRIGTLNPPSNALFKPVARKLLQGSSTAPLPLDLGLPASVDWRDKDVVTPVKNQGRCGSCWAFSSVAALESAILLHLNQTYSSMNVSLSQQQLVSCNWDNFGCEGGWAYRAFDYISEAGITTDTIMPYTSSDNVTGVCNIPDAGDLPINIVKLTPTIHNATIFAFSEADLLRSVARQPTVISFNVRQDFYNYQGGIYNTDLFCPAKCGADPADYTNCINHAMLAVGFTWTGDRRTSYWIVKNSWGPWWGRKGYIYIAMDGTTDGVCGINKWSFAPNMQFDNIFDKV